MSFEKYKAVVITAIIAVTAIAVYFAINNNHSSSISQGKQGIASENPDSIYFRDLEKECSKLNKEVLLNRKRFAEKVLQRLESSMESDTLNPEEKHEAILLRSYIKHELAIYEKHLH